MRLVIQPLNPEPLPLPPSSVFSLIISLFVVIKGDFHNAKGVAEERAECERSQVRGLSMAPGAVRNDAMWASVFKTQQGCFSFTKFLTFS